MHPNHPRAARLIALVAGLAVTAGLSVPAADAGLCFTSGKVYVQQKVFDKAARFLECARKEEPDNLQVYGLLAFSRSQLRQYRASGAVYQIGIEKATAKKNDKTAKDLKIARDAALAGLYNKGIAAMSRAGNVAATTERTTDEGTPQGKLEKEKGVPSDFARWTEGGAAHEVWYYSKDAMAYYFPPTGEEPTATPIKPPSLGGDLQAAARDSTVFNDYDGASKVMDAAYNFELAAIIDPTSADVYQNLSYLYELIGRIDDAIAAAKLGLQYRPGDQKLMTNMRVAASGRANRLYNAGQFKEAAGAYWSAAAVDPASNLVYLSRIGESWLQYGEQQKGDDKKAERSAAYDSAGADFSLLYRTTPPESTTIRANAIYNTAVIATRQDNNKKALEALAEGLKTFPDNLDLLGMAGQVRYQAGDYDGSIAALRHAVELDAREASYHQFLFLSYLKQNKKDASAAEYAMYKALGEGKQRKGKPLEVWVDTARNRLGPTEQLTATKTANGYPDELYTYDDDGKKFESWFYWGKGKSFTFMEGQVFSQGTFPAQKVN